MLFLQDYRGDASPPKVLPQTLVHQVEHLLANELLAFLRKNPGRSHDCAQRCVRAVAMAIRRLYCHLAQAVDAAGKPPPVLQDFARPVREHLLIPSDRGGGHDGTRAVTAFGGCFTCEPPGAIWAR